MDLGSTTSAHASMDVEAYMVHFKNGTRSRKDTCAGVARMYGLTEKAYLWNLTPEDLKPSPWEAAVRFSCHSVRGKRAIRDADPSKGVLCGVLGLWLAEGLLPNVMCEYFTALRAHRGPVAFPSALLFQPRDMHTGVPRPMTKAELVLVRECCNITHHAAVNVRNSVEFCTSASAKGRVHDDSHIMVAPAPADVGLGNAGSTVNGVRYGTITQLFSHCVPGQALRWGAQILWHSAAFGVGGGPGRKYPNSLLYDEMPILRRGKPTSRENLSTPVVWLDDCYAQGLGLWPFDLAKPKDDLLLAVYRNAEFHPHNR